MPKTMIAPAALMLCGALMLGACSSDGGLLSFGDSTPAAAQTAALPERPKSDPACQTLAARIAELKQDGAVDRVEKAAQGKGDTVSVKRASLAKVGELNKANAEFQARCSSVRTTAGVQPTVTQPTPTVTQPSGATTAAAVGKQADAAGAKAKAATKSE